MAKGLTRRELLKILGMLGIGIPFMPTITKAQSQKIIVIGAGASGLMAGYWLMDAGYDVIILEARDRVGGRAWSNYDLAPYPIELGAEFIHGDKVKTWDILDYFDEDTIDDETDTSEYLYYENELWTAEEFAEEYDVEEELEEILFSLIAEKVAEIGDDDVSVDSLFGSLALDYPELVSSEIRQLLLNKVANEYGGSIETISAHSIIISNEEDNGAGDFRLENGYGALMTAIAGEVDVRLNMPVTAINWDDNTVRITTLDGQEFEADKVIITLPLGVLKSNQVTFSPSLPDDKLVAIQKLGAGHVDKLILKFDKAFWEDDFAGVDTTLSTQIWWRPGIERGDDELAILTALIGGDSAIQLEAMSEIEAIQAGLNDLETMFGISDLQNRLVEGHFIAWGNDPFSLMGYSYIPVGAKGQNEVLATAISNILFFAGEATHLTNFATVHGAIESGIRVANDIIELR